jgi:hypothetical protein
MTFPTETTQEAPMETTPTPIPETPHYRRPDWFTRNVFNRLVKAFTRLGLSVWGSRVLEHRGRTSGKLHHTPVNLLTYEGQHYLVAPRGDTQWVRNVRSADGHLVLILGRHREHCTATEIPVENSVPILRSYLKRWAFETGMFFGGITADASDAEWAVEAPRHPVFALAC